MSRPKLTYTFVVILLLSLVFSIVATAQSPDESNDEKQDVNRSVFLPIASSPPSADTGELALTEMPNFNLDELHRQIKGQALVLSTESSSTRSTQATSTAFTRVDVVGATRTFVNSINERGDFVGYYQKPDGTIHGYVSMHHRDIFVDMPGAASTVVLGINNRGNFVGHFSDATGARGLWYDGRRLWTLNVRGAQSTYLYGISDAGRMVGDYRLADGQPRGFISDGRTYTDISTPAVPFLILYALNNAQTIVGSYTQNAFTHGFTYRQGTLTTIDGPNTGRTEVRGINEQSSLVGFYHESGKPPQGFIQRVTSGVLTPFSVPVSDAVATALFGINNQNTLVGSYVDSQTIEHGFIYTGWQ